MPINTPTISIVDNADGTGGVLTVAGATALTTNTVYGTSTIGGAFASMGSRSGNGTVALALSNGRHWAYVLSELAGVFAVSLVSGFQTTDGADAVFFQILESVQAEIQALNLAGIDADDVVLQKVPAQRPSTGTGVIVYPSPEQMPASGQLSGSNERDGVGYGINVVAYQTGNQDLITNLDRLLLWRQQLNRYFRNSHLQGPAAAAGITGVLAIEPGEPVVPDAWKQMYDVTGLRLRVWTREPRGV